MKQTTRPDSASLQARVNALRTRHARLDEAILAEQRRPLPSMGRLRALKARKLMLKDEMTYYRGVLQTLSSMGGHEPQGAA